MTWTLRSLGLLSPPSCSSSEPSPGSSWGPRTSSLPGGGRPWSSWPQSATAGERSLRSRSAESQTWREPRDAPRRPPQDWQRPRRRSLTGWALALAWILGSAPGCCSSGPPAVVPPGPILPPPSRPSPRPTPQEVLAWAESEAWDRLVAELLRSWAEADALREAWPR